MKKFGKLLLMVMLMSLIFAGCNQDEDEMVAAEPDFVVATVNGFNIYRSDVAIEIFQAEQMLMHGYRDIGARDLADAIREEAVNLAAFSIVAIEYARSVGIILTGAEILMVYEHVNDLVLFHGAADFETLVREDGFHDIAHVRRFFESQLLVENMIWELLDDPARFAPFEGYMALEPEYEVLAAKHILAHFQQFDTEEEAYEYARLKHTKAISGDYDFWALVEEFGQDPGMAVNPNGYTFIPGVMAHEFEQGTRELAMGEISDVIRTGHGYHIILRVEPDMDNIMFPQWYNPPSLQDRMAHAIFVGLDAMVGDAEIVLLPALVNVQLPTE